MNSREKILSLLNGQPVKDAPAFSGLIHVTVEGVKREGLAWTEIHHDAAKMSRAAASTFRATRLPSATLPLDFCAPAEALGTELVFYGAEENMLPQVKTFLVESATQITAGITENTDVLRSGRMPVILEALRRTKNEIGGEAVLSGMIPGPYTLLLYLCNPKNLFIEMKREPQAVINALVLLASFLARIGMAYREAGADFVTVHEMGGSPGFIGPARYEQFVHPALKKLIERLPKPNVLSVCGDATKSLTLLADSGADGISLDQTVDLASARSALGGTLLFGNVDPVATLWQGDPDQARVSARRAKEAGVDAVWPGCDLVPGTPLRNVEALSV
ncbi:MAG: Uroporphyrinogen decarboxylase [Anaerolineales bacterium]|nr:Uroporphyrinogen decarboxylase [Anaerolineales bacterium]